MPAPLYSGKVRDIYAAGNDRLLMVTSDRISAFDVVMAEPVPDKGRVLTALTDYWLHEMRDVVAGHLVSTDPADFPPPLRELPDLDGRSMLVRKADMLPIECVVRGYISGSAWSEYNRSGTVNGTSMPAGLVQSQQLPEPLFTPSTKATDGHDENITFDQAVEIVGDRKLVQKAAEISLEVYARGSERARERGIIIADTKFELGFIDGELALCDEVLTPDSSRFWATDSYQPGTVPPSFDKQPVRDWLEQSGWDKSPPPPPLPPEVVSATAKRYATAYEVITGRPFSSWPGVPR